MEKFESCDFTKQIWTNFHSYEHKCLGKNILLKHYFHFKHNKNYVGIFFYQNPFYMFIKTLDEIKEKFPPNNIKCI
jgi:hypothetical protein